MCTDCLVVCANRLRETGISSLLACKLGKVCPHCRVACAECGEELAGRNSRDHAGETYCADCYDAKFVDCWDCDCSTPIDEAQEFDGRHYCEDCYNDRFSSCEACGEVVRSDDAHSAENGRTYCDSCYSDRYTTCESCGDEVSRDDSYSSENGDTYCEECYYEHYTRCEECDRELDRDEARCNQDGYYCDRCFPGGEWDWNHISPSHSYSAIGSRRAFGVELETAKCEGYESLEGETCFGCKQDGSIKGMEFVSPPLSSDRGLSEIDKFCDLASEFEVDSDCGFHLHIDVSHLDVEQIRRVAIGYKMTEVLWHSFVPTDRRKNHYCQSIPWTASDMADCTTRHDFGQWERYIWVNLCAISKHGTIEIRLHSSTLDARKVANWAKAHLRFVDWIIDGGDIESLSGDTQEQFDALSAIWNDDDLARFYAGRAGKFGTDLTPRKLLKEVA